MLFRKKHCLCDMFYFKLLNVAYKKKRTTLGDWILH